MFTLVNENRGTNSRTRLTTVTVQIQNSGAITPPPREATSGLPFDYQHARQRLASLRRVSEEAKTYAWDWLLKWRRIADEKHACKLPAPWIFGSEDGVVELEWHLPTRHLVLALHDSNFEYSTRELVDGREVDGEGEVGIGDVCALLLWVVSA